MRNPLDPTPRVARLATKLFEAPKRRSELTGTGGVEPIPEVDGAEAGLAVLDRLDLDGCQYFHSTRADLLAASAAETRRERNMSARSSSRVAPDRHFLDQGLAEVSALSAFVTGSVPLRACRSWF
jgi:RNA polymerase sigma-70 factor (ECF subfamily)